MGNTTSAQTPSYSEKYSAASDERRTASSSAAADLLAQLSLREGRPSRAAPGITTDNLSAWEDAFASNPKHRLASTVLSKGSLTETLVRREAQREDKQVRVLRLDSRGAECSRPAPPAGLQCQAVVRGQPGYEPEVLWPLLVCTLSSIRTIQH